VNLRALQPNSIFLYILLPILGTSAVIVLLTATLMTSPLEKHYRQRNETFLKIAVNRGIEYCDDFLQELLNLRLADDSRMNATSQREALQQVLEVSERLPQVHMLITDQNGQILGSSLQDLPSGSRIQPLPKNSSGLLERKIRGRPVFLHVRYFPFWRWHIAAFSFENAVFEPLTLIRRSIYLSLTAILAALLIILAITIHFTLKRPLAEIIAATDKISQRQFPTLHIRRRDEIGRVADAINRMVVNLEQNQGELQQSLAEKHALLQEVHHRVKNNLNIVISLLNLYEENIDSLEKAHSAFEESRQRIFSMALVHETLYNSESLSVIQYDEYLKTMVSELEYTYSYSGRIKYELDLEEIYLDITKAVPCGIAANELILNAHKHAFNKASEGKIVITLKDHGEGLIDLSVFDNGDPLPEDFSLRNNSSLGLHLITLLSQQINGSFDYECFSVGKTFTLLIPKN